MIDTNGPHGSASFWLDVADRVIKFLALLVGAAWTWMHYTRSRTYAKKLELELEGTVYFKDGLYLETEIRLKNLGGARHALQKRRSLVGVWAIDRDMKESPLVITLVFETENWIEPGESIDDSRVFSIRADVEKVIWLKVNLRVESEDREWSLTRYIRVETLEAATR